MMVEGRLHQAPVRLGGGQLLNIQRRLGITDAAVEFPQRGGVNPRLAAEIVMDQALGRGGAGGDLIHPRAAEPRIGEFGDGRVNVGAPGFFRHVGAPFHEPQNGRTGGFRPAPNAAPAPCKA